MFITRVSGVNFLGILWYYLQAYYNVLQWVVTELRSEMVDYFTPLRTCSQVMLKACRLGGATPCVTLITNYATVWCLQKKRRLSSAFDNSFSV